MRRTDFHHRMDALLAEHDGRLLPGAEPFFVEARRGHAATPAVLFLHGFTSSPQELRATAEHVARGGYTVSLPLLPGHGTAPRHLRATRWMDWYKAAEQELRRLLALGHECVVVVGVSAGGNLAVQLALQYPASVAGLIWIGGAPRIRRENYLRALTWIARRLLGRRYKRKRTVDQFNTVKDQSIFDERIAYPVVPLPAAQELYLLNSLTRRLLPLLQHPLHMIYGIGDRVVDHTVPAFVQRVVPAVYFHAHVLQDSRHLIAVDVEKERVYALLDDILATLSSGHAH